jgi:hypothetical protein
MFILLVERFLSTDKADCSGPILHLYSDKYIDFVTAKKNLFMKFGDRSKRSEAVD